MLSVEYVTGQSGGPPGWVEMLLLGLIGAGLATLLGRLVVLWLVRLVRRPDMESASVVADVVASAVAGDDPDLVVIRAAYDLTRLLDLADCRWARVGEPIPAAKLEADGTIRFGPYRWPYEQRGLPPHGVQRQMSVKGRAFGSIVLVPASPCPVSTAGLLGAVTAIDVLALCLDTNGRPATPGPSF